MILLLKSLKHISRVKLIEMLYNEHIELKSKRLNEHIYLKYPFRIEYYNIMWHLKLYKNVFMGSQKLSLGCPKKKNRMINTHM